MNATRNQPRAIWLGWPIVSTGIQWLDDITVVICPPGGQRSFAAARERYDDVRHRIPPTRRDPLEEPDKFMRNDIGGVNYGQKKTKRSKRRQSK